MSLKPSAVDQLLLSRRIIVTCGTGGVGKTTFSAALALRAALLGKNALVITIDPAKRLATSLGLEKLGDQPHDLTSALERAAKKSMRDDAPKEITGRFSALMPDTRNTFEAFIRGLSDDPELGERIIRNPIFQIFAREFSGTNEYMAMKRLYMLDHERQFDLIILDTPPSRNTLAFLDAPKLLARLFEEKLIKWLTVPANKLLSFGMKKVLGVLEKLTGAGFMTDLVEFAAALFEVRIAFTENLKSVTRLLESSDVGFVMVSVPAPDNAGEAASFIESLQEHHFNFDGIALNRTLSELGEANTAAATTDGERAGLELISALQGREKKAIATLTARVGGKVITRLPEMARDVHSVEDLLNVALSMEH